MFVNGLCSSLASDYKTLMFPFSIFIQARVIFMSLLFIPSIDGANIDFSLLLLSKGKKIMPAF